MAVRTGDVSKNIQKDENTETDLKTDLKIESIDSLGLEGQFNGEYGNFPGSLKEGMDCYGQFISPIKCSGCDLPIMLSTFYDGQHEEDGDVVRKGRVVLCGSFDPYKIRRHDLALDPEVDLDIFRINRNYYCNFCSDSCPAETVLESGCKNPFIRDVFNGPDYSELMQDRIQQLNCSPDCKGQCLLDACVRYIDDFYNVKKHCPDCKRVFYLYNVADQFENAIDEASQGRLPRRLGTREILCKGVVETRGDCSRCDEIMDMFTHYDFHTGEEYHNTEDGCIGVGCGGKCLDQYVKEYIVSSSNKRNR